VLGFVLGRSEKQRTQTVVATPAMVAKATTQPAPRFTASQLAEAPTDDWPTNGGDVFNQRYSALDQIDTANVSQLKGVWLTHLRKSATAIKYSAEGTPVEWKGILYVPTGADDVFAISVATGEILWQYKAGLDQTISTVCCGWESRGVAIGDGKVFIGQLDGKLVALDQKTGQVAWQTQVAKWQEGATITHAPLYVNGMVITGISGGEFGIRGRVTAFDASTGKERWRFYTVAGPGQVGGDTWPKGEYTHGGAPVWQTPAVDPKLGLLYFSTGNAANDLDGSKRPGKNLFTASIVALHLQTGKLAWYFQQVHHDIWDYDSPSPVVLFDHGSTHGIGEPSKTGWLYLLDRKTGKPLVPIVERPVQQSSFQRTWPTQPFPSNPPFVSHRITDAQFAQIVKITKATFKKGKSLPIVNGKTIFAPPGHGKYVAVTPGAQGGDNWPPSSYNPQTNLFYVCGQSTVDSYIAASLQHKVAKQGDVPEANFGSVFNATGFTQNPGTLTAIEATTGKIKWQVTWPKDSCYSGTTTTAGNVVFVGRNNGRLQAYSADHGKLLWSFQTGAGANNTPSLFSYKGKEYVAYYAGGNSLAGTAHGDNLWLFGLDGTVGPLPAPGAGTAVEHAGEGQGESKPAKPGAKQGTSPPDAAAGQQVFADNCSVCHGPTGHGGNGGPDLTTIASAKQMPVVVKQVENGGGGMPAFRGQLTQQQIENVAAYVTQKITGGK
jgi:alcohol dehydrogenase (cytochrome c)